AWAGVIWGLHQDEPAPADELLSQRTCLAAMVRPEDNADGNAAICLMRLTIAQDRQGNQARLSTLELAKAALNLDWSKPINLHVRIHAGWMSEVRAQGDAVQMSEVRTPLDWNGFSRGECGLLTFSARDRVDFTTAIVEPQNQE